MSTPVNTQDIRRERFEFVLTINDFIVCQRYFKILGLKNISLHSNELYETLDYCVRLIQNDLKSKTNLYNWYTAPQVFQNREEYDAWIPTHKLDEPSFVVFRDTEETFIHSSDGLEPYDKRYNSFDYAGNRDDETPNVIKFSFMDNGKVIYCKSWDGNQYPRFIRNNIDLSNSKNRYSDEGKPFESFLMKILNKDKTDTVSAIINEICNVCSMDNKEYTTKMTYGDTTYHSNAMNYSIKALKNYFKFNQTKY